LAGTVLIVVFPHFEPFLEVVSDPIVRFELALKTSNVFDMTVRPFLPRLASPLLQSA
jgi:hypothetical protein